MWLAKRMTFRMRHRKGSTAHHHSQQQPRNIFFFSSISTINIDAFFPLSHLHAHCISSPFIVAENLDKILLQRHC